MRVVVFGNSITQAGHQPEDKRWPDLLQTKLQARFPAARVTVINAGVGGNTSREGLQRMERDVLAHDPDWVTVEFGGNDAVPEKDRHVSLEEFRSNLEAVRTGIERNTKAKILLLTFPPIINEWHVYHQHPFYQGHDGIDGYIEHYRQSTRAFAARYRFPLADIDPALRQAIGKDGPEKYILPDGVHLTEQGNRVVAEETFRTFNLIYD
jgi:lysophospholipase L1-like esterase